LYDRLGLKTDAWAEINNGAKTTRYYLDENGHASYEDEIENARWGFNNKDWRKQGCTSESVLIVNGKEYKMDENGHFNVPKGEPVIYNGSKVIFPKEIGEFLRAKMVAELGYNPFT